MFYFRRDLRICDNNGLIFAQKFQPILPIFIFDPEQINFLKNNNFMNVLVEAVKDLKIYFENENQNLYIFTGRPASVIGKILKAENIKQLIFNADYSEYSVKRDKEIFEVCKNLGVECFAVNDVTLFKPSLLLDCFDKKYWKFVENLGRQTVETKKCFTIFRKSNLVESDYPKYKINKNIPVAATREFAKNRVKEYKKNDDYFSENLMISCHLKLGLISPREVYNYVLTNYKDSPVIRQLLWREFYFAWAIKTENIYEFIDDRFLQIKWRNNKNEIKNMWSGKTGYPLIDAAMNQLNKTGFMHNRGRLLVGFFSVKILRINPFGEHGGQLYFSKKLIDCCYANNTGNWHWVASDALDASGQRYSKGWAGRPTDPRNSKKYDPDCKYIKKWLPEVEKLTNKEIHNWVYKQKKGVYWKPIVDFSERWKEWMSLTN